MDQPTNARRPSALWRAITYFDPARAGFLKRMLRLALPLILVGMCGLASVALVASRSEKGRHFITYYLSATHHPDRALGMAEALVRDYPTGRWEYYRLEAYNLRHLGRVHESLAVYDRAIAVMPGEWWAHSHRCFYNAMLADASTVMDSCDRSIELGPTDPAVAYERRAIARALVGNRAGAIADLELSIAAYRQAKRTPPELESRERWLATLRAGDNPFTPEEIAREMANY
jgi:hypothetical protein